MKNCRKTAFLEKNYPLLSESEQEYMQTLLHSLLRIQNTAPAAPVDIPDPNQNGPDPENKEPQ